MKSFFYIAFCICIHFFAGFGPGIAAVVTAFLIATATPTSTKKDQDTSSITNQSFGPQNSPSADRAVFVSPILSTGPHPYRCWERCWPLLLVMLLQMFLHGQHLPQFSSGQALDPNPQCATGDFQNPERLVQFFRHKVLEVSGMFRLSAFDLEANTA